VIGPMVPPSIIMILYALVDNSVSIGTLFIAGIVPAILIAAGMCAINYWFCRKTRIEARIEPDRGTQLALLTLKASPALVLPIFIVLGIHGGFVTASEASVLAVGYAWLLGALVYRTIGLKALVPIALRAALASSAVLFLLATSGLFAWILTIEQVPNMIRGLLTGIGPVEFLIITNIVLLLLGTALEPAPAILITVPILAPMAHALGINSIQFAIVVILNLTMGMLTPPVGSLLFVASTVAKVDLVTLTRASIPMFGVQLVILALITIFPFISIGLVRLLS
jgi:C4-dicarboxylate transporter DctM subunit